MSDRVENNKKILSSLRDGNANREHIIKRFWKRITAIQIITLGLKRQREDAQKAATNAELYLDDWAFHHGGLTTANMKEAMADCVDRIVKQHTAKQQQVEQTEFRRMQGPLAEFDDEKPMVDIPGDADFERYVLKQHPELKRK